jgi:DNA-directed RNA polymerase subunit H (RpoH/RPB5)
MSGNNSQLITSGTISTLFKSRNNLLQLLKAQGYDIEEYTGYGVNEVQTMYTNDQLDMLLTSDKHASGPSRKVYVKYHLARTLRRDNINNYIDDLFHLEQVLNKGDTLLIIMKQEVNETLINILNQIWEQDEIFIVIMTLDRLQYNILEHTFVPKHTILSETETEEMMKRYNIMDVKQLPSISRYDPIAVAIGMRPGQVCKITRSSKTAINSTFYRYCCV